jgi:DnaJ-class molecular chaperone
MRGSAYKVFGLNPGASEEDIRKRYRELVKKFHPDVNKSPRAEEKFIEIQAAYEELMQAPEEQLDIEHPSEPSFQEEYTAYREHARQQFQSRKKKEAEELEKLYVRLQTGPVQLLHRCIAFVGVVVLLALILDLILPNQRV